MIEEEVGDDAVGIFLGATTFLSLLAVLVAYLFSRF